ncbi:uncharacterized protein LOC108108683 isoform X1 [Drosophila eugracilis]|uniref:uncharacterized protein LOC108108683 isoform X1 n=1 Tax=Drosophila eugracilis TaxID=29029 RepID=UPI0007E65A17|nr:uncharacterized protein LOC108108683 isoform X1 [Drosophila eugracilis]XP_017072287.1 uncharacterized protein LOC108108683 isoform X1 [Drosophila eugracilis]
MLQPRKTNRISDRCLKESYMLHLRITMPYSTYYKQNLALLTTLILTMAHIEACLAINQSYLLSPTPTFPAIAGDDITTILLVNNKSGHGGDIHGRYLTVRPEIGVLTSTVRTFIQDGITTEFSTKVIGTTLNRGRLYAQYLKKSSRVLYENEKLEPSVVTSWVGEEDSLQTALLLQTQNDIFNSDDVDWQDIDNSIRIQREGFVGNTDFVMQQSAIGKNLKFNVYSDQPLTYQDFVDPSNIAIKIDVQKTNEMNKMVDDKVLSIEHLKTFTVKNTVGQFTTSALNETTSNSFVPKEERNHGQLMEPRTDKNVESQDHQRQSHNNLVLATITYYGFAEFTTVVGDSVIVFSPSTIHSSMNFGHVTSIMGKPTLPNESYHSNNSQSLEIARSTLRTVANSENNYDLGKVSLLEPDFSFTADKEKNFHTLYLNKLETSVFPQEVDQFFSNGNFQSLSQDDLKTATNHTIPNIQKQEGATTVFKDDDPFSSFIDLRNPSTLKLNIADQEQTLKKIEISKSDEMHKSLTDKTVFAIKKDSLLSEPGVGRYEIDNNSNKLCNHTTSQVFLTQMPKQLETNKQIIGKDSIVINTNPLFEYDIVQTTKYYCIRASQSKHKPELNTIFESYGTVSESQGELLSIEDIDDVDETTCRDLEDYDMTTENENESEDDSYDDVIYKTLFTTYTYLTTFFEGSHTTISSHTEILTNIVSSKLAMEGDLKSKNIEENQISENTIQHVSQQSSTYSPKYTIPIEIASLVKEETTENNTEKEKTHQTITTYIDDIKYSRTLYTTYTYYTSIFTDNKTEVQSQIEIVTNYISDTSLKAQSSTPQTSYPNSFSISEILTDKQKIEKAELMTFNMVVNSSRCLNCTNQITVVTQTSLDDQISSESNTEEILPSATFLLQTSYTTFTFYTTMYVGDDTNVISRLETITNVATETLQPTKLVNIDHSSFPITYFTTFTYWTKLAKDGEITTLSREETLSNVIQPSNVSVIIVDDSKTINNEAIQSTVDGFNTQTYWETDIANTEISAFTDISLPFDITTYFTTYTYYTTSYDVNMTIIDSRYETVTNVVSPRNVSSLTPGPMTLDQMIKPSQPYIKDDYSTITGTPKIVFYDYKQIIDAEKVSTLYFTTEIISSMNSEGQDLNITSSTTRLYVDESKKSILATILPDDSLSVQKMYKTGLVRLIEGKRIQNSTTTLYQSKVIGTVISNRYAQIIESTSSFFFEKKTSDDNLLSTTVKSFDMATQNYNLLESIEFVKSESDEIKDPQISKIGEDVKKNYTPINTKRPFAPVIRPFASRNRPTFAPKQKIILPSSATIITRSDVTPTITATPALKSAGRYSSSRRSVISNVPINPNEQSLSQAQSSRRLFGRQTKSLIGSIESVGALQSSDTFSPLKTRFALSSRPLHSSRRQNVNVSYRSSNIPVFRGSGIISNSRLRINVTNSGLVPSVRTTQSITQAKDLSSESSAEEEDLTDEIADDEENYRRNNNPLLRFRRPINGPSGFAPVLRQTGSSQGISLRQNPLLARSKTSTTTSSTTTTTTKPRSRSLQRPIGLLPRSRTQNTLFPPRGLFLNQQKDENKLNDNVPETNSEFDEYHPNNNEDVTTQENVQRRKRSLRFLTRPKNERRVRRQVDTQKRNRFRYRRQNQTATFTKEESKLIGSDFDRIDTTSPPREKPTSRIGSRYRQYTQATLVDTSTATNHRSIRPTRMTTKRPQFTLREKDTSLKSSVRSSSTNNFRRQQTTGKMSIRRPVGSSTGNSSSRRLNSYITYNPKNNVDLGRLSSTPRSRNSNSNTLKRGRGRGRNRIEYPSELQSVEHEVHSITVTHFIPSEVTVSVVSGHVTEYKNIVTAKTSTELLGPNDYVQLLGTNGLSSTFLNREVSSINVAGATEHTKYLLHESITSSIIFTPTTIRGRKTSFSHIIPSTAYSVEYIVTTIQPQISDNAPLANILLSQLLLGNLNLPTHPIISAVRQPNAVSTTIPTSVEPLTEYLTHTSTYVTTIFDGKSTILPVTFQGKKILTTVYDTTAQTITATEYSVDTIVNTLSVQNIQSVGPVAHVNNLLLQQLLLQQQQESLSQTQVISNTLAPQLLLSENLQDLDDTSRSLFKSDAIENVGYDSDFNSNNKLIKTHHKKSRKVSGGHKHSRQSQIAMEQQDPKVITLYVSGRRPGEFSTVLSTIGIENDHSVTLQKRHAFIEIKPTNSINHISYTGESEKLKKKTLGSKDRKSYSTFHEQSDQTASLGSFVGDVDLWYAKSSRQSTPPPTTTIQYGFNV